MSVPMCVATASWLLLVIGVVVRHRRSLHVTCMSMGMLADFTLVLYLQLTKSAAQTAWTEPLTIWQQLHIAASFAALLMYIPVSVIGWRLFLGPAHPVLRLWHIRIALAAFALRSIGWCLMFSMASLR